MGKFGDKTFSVSGTLLRVPKLEKTTSGIEIAKFILVVVERNVQTKEETTSHVPITAFKYDAKGITNTKYIKAGQFFTVRGSIRTREYQDKNGNTQLAIELLAGKIMGG